MEDETTKKAAQFGAQGGKARARNLTKQQLQEIGRKGAAAKWAKANNAELRQALRAAPLVIAGIEVDCAVLDDKENTRVVSETKFMQAMGMYRSGALSTRRRQDERGAQIPLSLAHKNLKPFIDQHLGLVHTSMVSYRTPEGSIVTAGIPATLIPKICEVWIDADRAGVLGPRQKLIAKKADVLHRGLAHVGIIGLIDEATGFQDLRPQYALAKILEQFVAKEFRKWTRTFPLEYFRELCRLRKVPFPIEPPFRLPQYFGHLTNDIIYARMAPYVLAELRRKNPAVAPGRRRHKHFQWLTENIGDPRLREHLWKVIGIMQVFTEWEPFYEALNRILPKFSTEPLLAIAEGQPQSIDASIAPPPPASQSPDASLP
jgi:hypothetical protein